MDDARTARRRYDRIAPVYDLFEAVLERARYRRWRSDVWAAVGGGRVLEVGVGTGLNLSDHPRDSEIVGIDLSPKMLERARGRREKSTVRPSLALMEAQELGFPGACFDAAVSTFVFCSVPDPVRGLREVRRVLRPGAAFVLLEHVRSPNATLGRIMDWMNPLMVRITVANINRDTVADVRRAGFRLGRVEDVGAGEIFKVFVGRAPGAGGTGEL